MLNVSVGNTFKCCQGVQQINSNCSMFCLGKVAHAIQIMVRFSNKCGDIVEEVFHGARLQCVLMYTVQDVFTTKPRL